MRGSAGPRCCIFVVICRIVLITYPCCCVLVVGLSSHAPLSCPCFLSSLLCGCPVLPPHIIFPCGCYGTWCQQAGRDKLGMGSAHLGVVSLFGCHFAMATWHLVCVSGQWWFSWWWQPLLYVWLYLPLPDGFHMESIWKSI